MALRKFIKKVKIRLCEFWHTPEELAYQVATTLSIKSKLVIDNRGQAILYNNIGNDIQETENDIKCELSVNINIMDNVIFMKISFIFILRMMYPMKELLCF